MEIGKVMILPLSNFSHTKIKIVDGVIEVIKGYMKSRKHDNVVLAAFCYIK